MSVTLENLSYGPSCYVYMNGGPLTFTFDTVISGTVPATFDWHIDLMQSDDSTVWQTIGPYTQPTSGPTTTVSTYYTPPSQPPQGGVRPHFNVDAGDAGSTSVGFCSGSTPAPPCPPTPPDQCNKQPACP